MQTGVGRFSIAQNIFVLNTLGIAPPQEEKSYLKEIWVYLKVFNELNKIFIDECTIFVIKKIKWMR